MQKNRFAPASERAGAQTPRRETPQWSAAVPDYTVSPSTLFDHIASFFIGFAAGFVVLFIFYKVIPLAVLGGAITGTVYIFVAEQAAIQKRLKKLRVQFYDLLEAMSVAMRAGNPVLKALESAREDLTLIYPGDSDILVELDVIIKKFDNAIPFLSPLPTLPGEAAWRMWPALLPFTPLSRENPAGRMKSSEKLSRLSLTRWRLRWRSIR